MIQIPSKAEPTNIYWGVLAQEAEVRVREADIKGRKANSRVCY